MTEETKPRRSWTKPLLFVSLAINLLIVGVVVGWSFSPDGRKDRSNGPIRGVLGEPFVRALPQESRREFLKDIGKERGRFSENRETLRARFDGFLDVLRSDTFEIETARQLLQEQRSAGVERQEFGEELLLRRLSEMSMDERATYADELEKALKRVRRR